MTSSKATFVLGTCLALSLAGCAGVEATRAAPGTLAQGKFAPTRPAVAEYGPGSNLKCPPGGIFDLVRSEIAKSRKPLEADPRLCAIADSLLGWPEADPPREIVMRPLGWHFGIAGPSPRASIGTLRTEDAREVAQSLAEVALKFAADAQRPQFGLATQRLRSGVTKTVLTLRDATLELDGVARRVPAGATVTVVGRATGPFERYAVLASSPTGKLERSGPSSGDRFQAGFACGDRPGTMVVEVRGEAAGRAEPLARFPIGCGVEPLQPSISVPTLEKGPVDAKRTARVLFDGINEERQAVGLPPVTWDDAVADAARRAAEAVRDSIRPDGPRFDLGGALKSAGVPAPLVLENPVAALSAEEARALIAISPVNRSNVLDPKVSAAAVGIATESLPDGRSYLYAAELLVRYLPPVDAVAVKNNLREAIAKKRAAAHAAPLAPDPTLDDVAQRYATEIAAGHGTIPKEEDNRLVGPLYRSFRTVNILSGVKVDPMEFADEPGMVAPAQVMGIGVAPGTSPTLGKNSAFVVVLTGTRHAAAGPQGHPKESGAAPAKGKRP